MRAKVHMDEPEASFLCSGNCCVKRLKNACGSEYGLMMRALVDGSTAAEQRPECVRTLGGDSVWDHRHQ